jgi:hypothetical protein
MRPAHDVQSNREKIWLSSRRSPPSAENNPENACYNRWQADVKKVCAFGLLILASSPFTAPFQTCDTDHVRIPLMAAPFELLSTFGDDIDPCDLVSVPFIEPNRVTIAPLFGVLTLTSSVASYPATCLTRSAGPTSDTGDHSIQTTILRL